MAQCGGMTESLSVSIIAIADEGIVNPCRRTAGGTLALLLGRRGRNGVQDIKCFAESLKINRVWAHLAVQMFQPTA